MSITRALRNPRKAVEGFLLGGRRRRGIVLAAWQVRARVVNADIADDALRLSARFASRGHLSEARRVCQEAERTRPTRHAQLRLRLRRARIDLTAGRVPEEAEATIVDALAGADDCFGRGDDRGAAELLDEVFAVAFHRATHFQGAGSPLAVDPTAFLAPFTASRAFRALTTAPGPERRSRSTGPARKILFVSLENWNFVREIVEDYRQVDGLDVRTVDLSSLPGGRWSAAPVELIHRRLAQARGAVDNPPADLVEPFAWADVVFVEWGHRALTWTSLLPPLDARVVTRVHSYEVQTPMPFVTNWSAVDDVIFVAPAIRALAEAAIPGLTAGPARHTVANRNRLAEFHRPKRAGAERTMALIGWNSVWKDPAWAVEVLERLREHDETWRLLLVGHPFGEAGLDATVEAYRRDLHRRMVSLGTAVQTVPFTDDVPGVLSDVGVILSSSRREGTHEGFIQGVASGALPVVRDWPYLARWGGPRGLFPSSWVVATPEEAASRILAVSASPDRLQQIEECRAYVMDRFDYSRVRGELDRVVLGGRDGGARPADAAETRAGGTGR